MLACFTLHGFTSYAGVRLSDGVHIPDELKILNSSESAIEIEDIRYTPSKTAHIFTAHTNGRLIIRQANRKYEITFPAYQPYIGYSESCDTEFLDFTTVKYIAEGLTTLFPKGLDMLSIKNDTIYKIAVVYALNKVRSPARITKPDDVASKVVQDQPQGKLNKVSEGVVNISYLEDVNPSTCQVTFSRHICVAQRSAGSNEWNEVTLSAHTLKLFSAGGFSVTVS